MTKHAGGRPRKWESVEDMAEAIEKYFAKCDERMVWMIVGDSRKKAKVSVPKPETYTIQGLAVFLGLTMAGLLEYEKRDEFFETIKEAKTRIEANKVTHLLDGDGYGPGRIFDLKNNCGWQDKQEIEHSGEIKGPLIIVRKGNEDTG